MNTTAYPSYIQTGSLGSGLFAVENLDEGTVVERFEGRIVPYSKIPENELRYAFEISEDRWVVPQSNAKYINHSCDPTCYISANQDILTARKVVKGEELTLMYNEITMDRYMKSGAVLPLWDERRSFDCLCGSAKCAGRIDCYVIPVPENPNSRSVRMGIVPGQGRGMFAARRIVKGELIERAPVVVVPDKQWSDMETSILSDYAFDWGEQDQHAAIALGYISVYNHSYSPNAQLEQLLDELMMEIIALRDIAPGEEITINYNGDPENQDRLWFNERAAARRSRRKRSG